MTSSQVTFTFSEAPVGFTAADISAAGGTVTGLTATADPLVYTATFTASDGFSGTGSVAADGYTDAAGNAGAAGSDTVTIDTITDPNDFDSLAPGPTIVTSPDGSSIFANSGERYHQFRQPRPKNLWWRRQRLHLGHRQ